MARSAAGIAPADHRNAAENERAEPACADGRGNRGHADGDDCRGTNTGKNHGTSEREANAPEDLPFSHAHSFRGFEHSRVNPRQSDIRVAKYGKERIENERDDRGAASDAADKWNGNQEAEKGEAGDGLENTGEAEREIA